MKRCKTISPSPDHLRLVCNLRVCAHDEHDTTRAVDVGAWLLKKVHSLPVNKMVTPPSAKIAQQQQIQQQQLSSAPSYMPDLVSYMLCLFDIKFQPMRRAPQQVYGQPPMPSGFAVGNWNAQQAPQSGYPIRQGFIPQQNFCGPPNPRMMPPQGRGGGF